MRGCRGRSVEESIDNYQFSQRKTNTGEYASDWAARGEAIGVRMHKHKEEGFCKQCPFFKKKRLCGCSMAEFKQVWGSDGLDTTEDKCSIHVDDFYKNCPEEKRGQENR